MARLWNWNACARRSSLTRRPTPAPGDGRDAGEDAQHFGEGERHQRARGAPQAGAERERADDRAGRGSGHDAGGETDPGVDAIMHLQDRISVSAGAEEGGLTEGILPAVTAEDVPA